MSQLKRKRAGVQIDDLLYSYMNNGNRLESVVDGATTDGYVPNTGTYTYDQNGNTTYDPSRGINIQYNHLNLPTRVEFGPDDMVFYYYSTTGIKQGKQVRTWHTAASYTTQYSGSFTYTNNTLSSIATPAGRLVPVLHNGQVHWKTEYNLTDHLGNVRVVFAAHANGQPEVMQQTSYYPFGYTLQQNDYYASVTSENKHLYNGKELQDDVLAGSTLDWYDYGARFYDPVVPHFLTVDPLAEVSRRWSPYNYCMNNPIRFIDPDEIGPLDGIMGELINKAVNYIAKKVEAAVVETGKTVVESAKSYASNLEVGVRLEGSASVSLGMQAGVKGEAIGAEGNGYSEDMININGSVEYSEKGGNSHVDAGAEVYVKNNASDKRSTKSVSVSESAPTPIGVVGLEQSVSSTSTNQQNGKHGNSSSMTAYFGAGWNGVVGGGLYYTNSTSGSGKSNEAGVRVGTSRSAALVIGGSYDLSLKFFVRVKNDDE